MCGAITSSETSANNIPAITKRQSVRRHDVIGTLLDFWPPDELQELGDILATLPAEGRQPGEVVQVTLRASATETGTLELTAMAVDSDAHWKVAFDVRERS